MPADVISLIGLTATFVPWPVTIGGAIAKGYTKDTAEKNLNDAAQKYDRLKQLRQEVNQYFTEDERAYLDTSIERMTFELMELEATLLTFKDIACWRVFEYRDGLKKFNHDTREFLTALVVIHKEIKADHPQSLAQSTLNALLSGQPDSNFILANNSNDHEIHRDIRNVVMKEAVSAIRSQEAPSSQTTVTRQTPTTAPIGLALPDLAKRPIVLRRSAAPGTRSGWHVENKSSIALTSITDIEMKTLGEQIDCDVV